MRQLHSSDSLDPENHLDPPVQVARDAASESPYGTSVEPTGKSLTVEATADPRHSLLGLEVYTAVVPGVVGSTRQFDSREGNKGANASESTLGTVLTTTNSNVTGLSTSSTAWETVEGNSSATGHGSNTEDVGGDVFTTGILEEGEMAGHLSTLQPITEDVPSLLPGAATMDHPISLLSPADQPLGLWQASNEDGPSSSLYPAAKPTFVPTDTFFNRETEPPDGQEHLNNALRGTSVPVPAVSPQSDDWDDTKLGASGQVRTSQPEVVDRSDTVTELNPAVGGDEEEDDVKKVLPPILSGTTAQGSQNTQFGSTQEPMRERQSAIVPTQPHSVYVTDPSTKDENLEDATVLKHSELFPETATTTDITKLHDLETVKNILRGNSFLLSSPWGLLALFVCLSACNSEPICTKKNLACVSGPDQTK